MLKKILLALLILIVVLLGIGFFLPVEPDVTRTIVIGAPASAIYPTVATLKTWPDWTVWNRERDPDCEWSFEGPDTGAGAVMKWKGRAHMEGTLTIDTSDPATGIQYTLAMKDMDPMKGSVVFAGEETGTKVTWRFHGEFDGMPWTKWMQFLFVEPIVGASFEEGLGNLKTRVEEAAAPKSEGGKATEASADKDKDKK